MAQLEQDDDWDLDLNALKKSNVKIDPNIENTIINQPANFQGASFQGRNVSYIGVDKCPEIPAELTAQEFLDYFFVPELSSIYEIEESFAGIDVKLKHGEEGLNIVKIPTRLFAPSQFSSQFPRFVLDVSKFHNSQFDYNGTRYILNQNELLYMLLHHRITMFSSYKQFFSYLLTKDIQNLLKYSDYNTYNSANSIKKAAYSVAILDVFEQQSNAGRDLDEILNEIDNPNAVQRFVINTPIGERIMNPKLTAERLKKLFRDLNIVPSSESMGSETGKFVITNKPEDCVDFYKAAGFKIDNEKITTIFQPKPNLPARLKSHVVADAFKAEDFSRPIFAEDIDSTQLNNTDETLINAVVVFMPIENSGRFVCGEIECSEEFAGKKAIRTKVLTEQLNPICVKEGQVLKRPSRHYVLGMDENGNTVPVYGYEQVTVSQITEIGIENNYKLTLECVKRIGSSRIISTTGVKGVTKPKHSVGKIYPTGLLGNEIEINVDILVGPNSFKGKKNTIALAQAALAKELGYDLDSDKILSSLDVKKINELKNKLGKVKYIDANGKEMMVYAGIVPIRVSEMAYMYKSAKPQSFMTQAGWYLNNNGHKDISDAIWESDVRESDVEIVSELTKIIYDKTGVFISQDKLPVYKLTNISKVFNNQDIALDTNPALPHSSSLLTEANKGFYIYIPTTKEYLRMPSAQLINRFVSRIADGSFIYPRMLTVVSQILQVCINVGQGGVINTRLIAKTGEDRFVKSISYVNKYIEHCIGILHNKNNYLKSLMIPEVFGCNMKQMVDINVPSGSVIIMDRNLYEDLSCRCEDYERKNGYFNALCIRNPVLWKSQIQVVKVYGPDIFNDWLEIEGIKNPDEYLSKNYCSDLLLLNPEDALVQESDVDGDLMPLFVPQGNEVQNKLELFQYMKDNSALCTVKNITDQEIKWIEKYKEEEFSANDVFETVDEDYELYTIPLKSINPNSTTFAKYFINSVIAKGDVGLATSNLWSLQCLAEIYYNECAEGNVLHPLSGEKCKFTRKDFDLITYAYTRLVQDLVVRGIKWNESGSNEFKPFLLQNITARNNRPITRKLFSQDIGLGNKVTRRFEEMLEWGISTKMIDNVMAFISFYNRGAIASYKSIPNLKVFEEQLQKTFYGSRIKKYFDLVDYLEDVNRSGWSHPVPQQESS